MRSGYLPRLPVAVDPAAVLIRDDAGPVWPVATDAEYEHLSRVASLFGVDVERAGNTVSDGAPGPAGSGCVVCFEPELVPLAALYAHLTGRRAVRLGSALEVRSVRADVLLVSTGELTYSLLETVHAMSGEAAIGLITGRSIDEIRSNVLAFSAAAMIRATPETRRLDVLSARPAGALRFSGRFIVGRDAPPPLIAQSLGAGAGIVHYVSHSDGIDASLGPKLIFCSVANEDTLLASGAAPRCRRTGYCHWHDTTYRSAEERRLLFHARELRGRMVLFNLCWGLLPAGSTLDAQWGLAVAVLSESAIGALVTTWEPQVVSALDLEPLIDDLQRGSGIGAAIARYHRSEGAMNRAHRVCLFGDPSLALATGT
jgi:hypothetical protein